MMSQRHEKTIRKLREVAIADRVIADEARRDRETCECSLCEAWRKTGVPHIWGGNGIQPYVVERT